MQCLKVFPQQVACMLAGLQQNAWRNLLRTIPLTSLECLDASQQRQTSYQLESTYYSIQYTPTAVGKTLHLTWLPRMSETRKHRTLPSMTGEATSTRWPTQLWSAKKPSERWDTGADDRCSCCIMASEVLWNSRYRYMPRMCEHGNMYRLRFTCTRAFAS